MMKRTIMSIMLAVVALCGWAADGNTLKVKLDIVDFGDSVTVIHAGKQETFTGKDGKFEFELTVDSFSMAYFVQPKLLRGDMENPRIFSVPLVGGEEMRLWATNTDRYDVDGTGLYADYHQVDLFNEEAGKEIRDLSKKYNEMRNDESVSDEDRSKFYNEVYMSAYDRYQQKLMDYIKAHPGQEAAVTLLNHVSGIDKVKEAFALFDAPVREGRLKGLYNNLMRQAEADARAAEKEKEAAKKQAAGIEAPLFTLNDIQGNPLSLESLRGKYVILDFWGSWCIWCIRGFPQMKEYYAKYAGKFEILGVDCSDTEEKWKAAVEKHELPWLHVYCPNDATVTSDYGITGYPTKIIVGPDGKIVKSIVGEDPAFYTYLDELFGE